MKRRTRKWALVQQEAKRLAAIGLTPKEIARRLGVDKSSVTRWQAAGRLQRTGVGARASTKRSSAPVRRQRKQTPEEWAAAVRREYQLDATDDQLVSMGCAALMLAGDKTLKDRERLAAMGRFQSIVKQLALVARNGQTAEVAAPTAPPPKPRHSMLLIRSRPDPRGALLGTPEPTRNPA
jgi:hypothetical protein